MKYKAPSLVSVLQWLSIVAFILCISALACAVAPATRLLSLAAFGALAVFGTLGLLLSEFVDIIARAAFDIRRIADRVSDAQGDAKASHPAAPDLIRERSKRAAEQSTFYIARDGETQGPLTGAMVRQLVASGAITGDTPAMRKGDAEWQTVGAILGNN